jgi:hypothetical protein
MAHQKTLLEYKDRHLTRPELDGIIGAALRTNPDATEIIVRCRSATQPAYEAASSWGIKVTIVPNKSES